MISVFFHQVFDFLVLPVQSFRHKISHTAQSIVLVGASTFSDTDI